MKLRIRDVSGSDLKKAGRDLWMTIVREFEVDDAGSQALLGEICKSADLVAACRKEIDKDGLTVPSKAGVRDHPLLRSVLISQNFMARALVKLGVVDKPHAPLGRPPIGGYGVGPEHRLNGDDA